ncbi:hypothetical protein PPL_02912 [Heterostelium album PN500]|uniref:Uncharacterized protein n=1 Tax=Heterostelium pallidum (strain ATCC 26659 / Pp 5 / PN500) TaxID=670386 RepID=D3B3E5_HETP5|nr:hypothetical protein PPL_02912 [Heterostelium album PN500]EFA83843.1 hypothetical protein PPL_02912 [Heterostelium album PN500]|eukprot:XP_020435960.1 hypothetical protein PPL_02912 [Heterostelium album PN500]
MDSDTYILVGRRDGGANLINLRSGNIELIDFRFNLANTFNSFATIGESVYIFASYFHQNSFFRVSMRTKVIDFNGEFNNGVIGGHCISVCYDGLDHVYLIGGRKGSDKQHLNRIDRFNCRTNTFEKYFYQQQQQQQQTTSTSSISNKNTSSLLSSNSSYFIISVYLNGLIYSVLANEKSILIFNTLDRSIYKYQSDQLFDKTISACTDINNNNINKTNNNSNSDNIYLHSNDGRFIRFNVNSKVITKLNPIIEQRVDDFLSMVFHNVSEHENNIYLLGGTQYKYHRYSVENNHSQSLPLFNNLNTNNNNNDCGASIISF